MSTHKPARSSINWSDINENAVNLEKLRLLCSHEKALQREGYITAPLGPRALLAKLRCQNCGSKMKAPKQTINDHSQATIEFGAPTRVRQRDLCEFHPGRVINLRFTCCEAHVSMQRGCQINLAHVAPDNYLQKLELDWTYHTAPIAPTTIASSLNASNNRRGRARFTNRTAKVPHSAIALDCEFGVSILGESELIRISVIDFFTKQALIDCLVKPDVPIKNYVTRYSGVTSADMRDAVRNRTCIFGRDAARQKLLEFIDSTTVIVMHGGSSDLSSLRLIHPNILDTYLLETYFEAVPGGRSLKNLCKQKLDLEIQKGRGHDSLEDALACRELAICLMNLIPEP